MKHGQVDPKKILKIAVEKLMSQTYGAGEAADILGIPTWRLRNFLDGPAYQISIHDQIGGTGRGSRRIFSKQGLYRLAVATALVSDGFTPRFVGKALNCLSEQDFFPLPEEKGNEKWGIQLRRVPPYTIGGADEPHAELFGPDRVPQITPNSPVYYALDVRAITQWVDQKVKDWRAGKLKQSDPKSKSEKG